MGSLPMIFTPRPSRRFCSKASAAPGWPWTSGAILTTLAIRTMIFISRHRSIRTLNSFHAKVKSSFGHASLARATSSGLSPNSDADRVAVSLMGECLQQKYAFAYGNLKTCPQIQISLDRGHQDVIGKGFY